MNDTDGTADIDETTLAQRVALSGMVVLSERGETPADSADVRRIVRLRNEEADADIGGNPSEAEVIRALEALSGDGWIEQVAVEDSSPVGKGRATYRLNADAGAIREELANDERIAPILGRTDE